MIMNKKFIQRISLLLILCLLAQIVFPTVVLASSDKQNKSTSGSPLGAENMVNMFNGTFNYSIPVIDVPGPNGSDYSMSLNYGSSISPDEDASWVGYGWSLAPGSVSRQKRGIPDDLRGTEVAQLVKEPPIYTVAATCRIPNPEIFDFRFAHSGELTLRYNTIKGWSLVPSVGYSFNVGGFCSLNSNLSEQGIGFSPSVNFVNLFKLGSSVEPANLSFDRLLLMSQSPNECEAQEQVMKDALQTGAAFNNAVSNQLLSKMFTGSSTISLFSPGEKSYNIGAPETVGTTTIATFGMQNTTAYLSGVQNTTYITNFSKVSYRDELDFKRANGYLFTNESKNGDEDYAIDIMDYEVEKDKPLKANGRVVDNVAQAIFSYGNNNTKYLPVPYSNADMFNVTGPINGTFRAYHNKNLNFRLAPKKSTVEIIKETVEPITQEGVFPPIEPSGGSGGVGYGYSSFTSGKSDYEIGGANGNLESKYVADNPQFVFIGDKGSVVEGSKFGSPSPLTNNGRRISSSIPVTPITVGDRESEGLLTNGSRMGTFSQMYNRETSRLVDEKNKEKIVGFRFVDQQGKRCVYGQPLISQNEHQISFGVKDKNVTVNGKVAYSDKLSLYKDSKGIGEQLRESNINKAPYYSLNAKVMSEKYVTSYLLSEITTHDYVDVNGNGCDTKDFGGYTTFEYEESTFNGSSLIKWRSPARGFYYQQGSIYAKSDDRATVNYGLKNVVHLRKVATKTHAAYFVTNKTNNWSIGNGITLSGSLNERLDCNVPPIDEKVAGTNVQSPVGSNPYEYLERIHLYELDANGNPVKLLKKVHFAYDYSLQKNAPGCVNNSGKLTLKRVWTESEGITEKNIPQYVFGYSYPSVPTGIHSSYQSFFSDPAFSSNSLQENPDYNPNNTDDWGSFQLNGAQRYAKHLIGTNQNPLSDFDPAAYVLKSIQLPGGGQILVQYEQNSYRYVQDRPAMVMAPISEFGSGDEDRRIYIDPQKIPGLEKLFSPNATQDEIDLRTKEIDNIVDRINSMFINGGEQMYMKVLATLEGAVNSPDAISDLQTQTHDLQYLSAYASAVKCTKTGNGLIAIDFSDENDVPWEDIVENYIATHNLSEADGDPSDILQDIINGVFSLSSLIPQSFIMDECLKKLSYIKIPIGFDKKGGGIRVKRILTLNPENSLETGDAALYGTEYYYQIYDENLGKFVSSGVATNEPMASREANSLVRLVDDNAATYKDEIITGENLIQFEGPIGEELLPAPTIGYRQIIAKDINKGYSTGGYTIYRYNTVLEYPSVKVEIGNLNKDLSGLPFDASLGVASYSSVKTSARQSYRFILNSMHGTQQSIHHFSSQFTNVEDIKDGDKSPISSVEYTYFTSGESVPVMSDLKRPFRYVNLGQQSEYVTERRLLDETSWQGEVEGSSAAFTVPLPFFIPPIILPPIFSFGGSMQYSSTEVKTEVNAEVVTNAVFLRSVKTMQDGIITESENIAFDRYTGNPLIVRNNDGFNGLDLGTGQNASLNHDGNYYNYTVPAYFYYKELGPTSLNEGAIICTRNIASSLPDNQKQMDPVFSFIRNINIVNYAPNNSKPALKIIFESSLLVDGMIQNQRDALKDFMSDGDLIQLVDEEGFIGAFYIGNAVTNNNNELIFQDLYPATELAESGWDNPVSVSKGYFKIIKSGRANRLSENAATFTLYGGTKEIKDALGYAEQLRERQRLADVLNVWVNNGYGDQSPKYDQMFVYKLDNGTFLDPVYMDVRTSPDYSASPMLMNERDNHIRYALNTLYAEQYPANGDLDYIRLQLVDFEWRYHFPSTSPGLAGNFYGRVDDNPCDLNSLNWLLSRNMNESDVSYATRLKNNYFNSGQYTNPKTFEYFANSGVVQPACDKGEKIIQDITFSRGEIFGIDDKGELGLFTDPEKNTTSGKFKWIPRGSTRYRDQTTNTEVESNNDYTTNSPNRFKRQLILEGNYNYCAFPNILQGPGQQKILKASAIQYKNTWSYPYSEDNSSSGSLTAYVIPYLSGQKVYRPHKTYTYKSSIVSTGSLGTSGSTRIYTGAGRMNTTSPEVVVDRLHAGLKSGNSLVNSANAMGEGWVLVNSIEEYNPDGIPIDVKDAIGIHSSSRLSYNGTLIACKGTNMKSIARMTSPTAINGSEYDVDMYFQSFEPTGIKTDITSFSAQAHTGKNGCTCISSVELKTGIRHIGNTKNFTIKFWATDFDDGDKVKVGTSTFTSDVTMKSIAKVPYTYTPLGLNENLSASWNLYEGSVDIPQQSECIKVTIENHNPSSGANRSIVLDDFVMYPSDAAITCYVYGENNFRQIAEFNDNHFAKLTQYDMKGQPIREIIETTYGFKSVNERTNNIYKIARDGALVGGTNSMMSGQSQQSMQRRNEDSDNRHTLNGLWNPSGKANNVDIMKLNLSPEQSHIELFGNANNLDSLYLKKNNVVPTVKGLENETKVIKTNSPDISSDKLKKKFNEIKKDTTFVKRKSSELIQNEKIEYSKKLAQPQK